MRTKGRVNNRRTNLASIYVNDPENYDKYFNVGADPIKPVPIPFNQIPHHGHENFKYHRDYNSTYVVKRIGQNPDFEPTNCGDEARYHAHFKNPSLASINHKNMYTKNNPMHFINYKGESKGNVRMPIYGN